MRLLQPLLAWFQGLDQARRIRLFAALAVAAVAAVAVSWWASEEAWSPVVSGRGYDAAVAAAAAVEKAEIPYRLAPPDTLEVPAAKVGAARSAIAADTDLPGLADVSELQLGLTPQAQQWAFLRAAEGDLARMLNGIEGVVASQVHLVPREPALYVDEERPASASVFLQLEPGVEFSSGQIRAVTNLVANAVDGLAADRVSVADDRGNLLAAGDGGVDGDNGMGAMKSLADYRATLERRYERAVSQALLPVLGFGGSFSVTSTVELDLTEKETTTRQVDVDRQGVVSEVNEESTEARSRPSGVPGVDANLPERDPAAGQTGSNSQHATATVNYTYPTVDEVARRPAGGVQRISVAVQVDQARVLQLVEATSGKIDEADMKRRIEAAVQASVGFDQVRKDVVTVSYLPFAPPGWTVGTETPATPLAMVKDTMRYAVPVLALLLLFWFVVRPIVTAVVRPLLPEPSVAAQAVDAEVVEEQEDVTERLKALVEGFAPIDSAELNLLVDRESESAAEVLRQWSRA